MLLFVWDPSYRLHTWSLSSRLISSFTASWTSLFCTLHGIGSHHFSCATNCKPKHLDELSEQLRRWSWHKHCVMYLFRARWRQYSFDGGLKHLGSTQLNRNFRDNQTRWSTKCHRSLNQSRPLVWNLRSRGHFYRSKGRDRVLMTKDCEPLLVSSHYSVELSQGQ